MRIVSILENQNIEKRIVITPEIAKKYIGMGFEVLLSENYANHLGIKDEEYKELLVTLYSNRYYTLFRQFHTFGIPWYNQDDYIIYGNLNFQYDYVNENVISSVVKIYIYDKLVHEYTLTDIRDGFSDNDMILKVPKGTCVIEPLPINVLEDGTVEYKHNYRKKKQTFIPFIGISKKILEGY